METVKRKARVVHLMKDLGLGGTQKTAQLFCKELVRKYSDFYDVSVLYNAAHDLTRYREFQEILGSEARMVPYRFDAQGIEILQALQPDITHVYRAGTPEWPIAGKDIKRSIFVETNVFGFLDPNENVTKTLFMSNWLQEYSKRLHGEAIFNTLGQRGRFDFVNNPVDLPATGNKVHFELKKDTIILGRCGRPDDGIYDDINVKAALILQSKGHNIFFLTMAAPPRMLADLEKFSIPYQNINPTTDPHILSQFYNTIDILAHARADGETFGSNIAEAMMHSKPVVTHIAVPSHPRMGVFQAQTQLVQDGITGFVTEHNSAAYAEQLEKLVIMEPVRRKFGEAGKAWAIANCSTEVCGAKLHEIYQALLYRYGHTIRPRS
jgi:glycosyltransferase involved in cell wall biosynthesis